MYTRILAITMLLTATLGISQDTIPVIDGYILESLTEQSDDETTHDFYTLYENLEVVLNNPININRATQYDLEELGIFDYSQILDILKHRDTYGSFLSIYELQSIPSLDLATLRAAFPFITIGDRPQKEDFVSLLGSAQHTVFSKYKRVLQPRKGYQSTPDEGGYHGTPDHLYLRYKIDAGQKLRAALTIEKDPGEVFFDRNKGIEYLSGYLYTRNPTNFLDDVAIGDYSISMGQGLIMHNSFGGGKSSYVMKVRKSGRTIKPYGSINESNFLRGIAASSSLKNWKATVFGSVKKVDASAIRDSVIDTGFERVSSFNISGLHRTQAELARKHNTINTHLGGILAYKNRNWGIAANILHTTYDKTVQTNERPYKRYAFQGKSLSNLSIDYNYRYRNFMIFGESAMSDNRGHAHIHGILASIGRFTDAALVYRNYGHRYQVLQANAFSESSQPINERGIYMGLSFKPWKKWTFSTYYDLWNHDWYRYQKDAPTKGKEVLCKLEYYKKRKLRSYLQYRYESKGENLRNDNKTSAITDRNQHRLRLHMSYTVNKGLELRNRLEYCHTEKASSSSTGFMAYTDVIYKPIEYPYSFTARYAVFDTDDFQSRIYAYENDILYEFSIPFFSGKGSRFYINNRYKITRWLTAELHYGITFYNNTIHDLDFSGIGSGNERINDNKIEEIKIQLKFKY